MPRFDVTPALSETIKTLRVQNNIQAKTVANLIGKSPSYVSKLEKNEIKTIDSAELESILHFVAGSEDNFQKILESIWDVLVLRYSKEEIQDQLWFDNFDTAFRKIPITDSLVNELNSIKDELNISIEYLCHRINSNEDISSEIKDLEKYPYNEWQAYVVNKEILFRFIKMKVETQEIYKIFEKATVQSNYITLLSIAYYLLKIKSYGHSVAIAQENTSIIMTEAIELLNKHKFLSIADKKRLNNTPEKTDKNDFLSAHDKLNIRLMNNIIQRFQFFSDLDILKANECLSAFEKNLNWDNMFILSLLRLPFYELKDLNITEKKELFSSISNLIKLSLEKHKTKHTTDLYE